MADKVTPIHQGSEILELPRLPTKNVLVEAAGVVKYNAFNPRHFSAHHQSEEVGWTLLLRIRYMEPYGVLFIYDY